VVSCSRGFNPFYIRSWVRTAKEIGKLIDEAVESGFNPFYIRSWVRTFFKVTLDPVETTYSFNPFYIRSWVRTRLRVEKERLDLITAFQSLLHQVMGSDGSHGRRGAQAIFFNGFNPFYIRSWVRTCSSPATSISRSRSFNPFYIRSWVRTYAAGRSNNALAAEREGFQSLLHQVMGSDVLHGSLPIPSGSRGFNPFYIRSWVRTLRAPGVVETPGRGGVSIPSTSGHGFGP